MRKRGKATTLGTLFHVIRNEMGGKTEATSNPTTKNSQLMLMPILSRMMQKTPENKPKPNTDKRDTRRTCLIHNNVSGAC
jgi:hypothetical protein